jgi:uncharacterized pyridoxamine 5'-phosphate oxidase family protein
MNSIINFLKTNSTGFLATVENGKPRVRPFQFMLEENGRLYFCTNNTKAVYRQLQANPHVEFSGSSPEFSWIRLSGESEFTDDLTIKSKVLNSHPLVESLYQNAANPIFEVFYLKNARAELADFSGLPPKVVTF